jgi:predicted regulator of Ras-like GTPase activity (Roadblock/LC7/MglB family)
VTAGLATPVSIHDVACQRSKKQEKGDPEVLASSLSGVVQAEKYADGAAGRISQGEEVRLSIRSQHRQVLLARAHERILFVHSCAAKAPVRIS